MEPMITFDRGNIRFTYRVAGVALHEGRVLLNRASTDDYWFIPGGRAELLESSPETLRREMAEELGADVEIGRLLWIVENFFGPPELRCHELGLYYLISFPRDPLITARRGPFIGGEEDFSLIYEWHPLAALDQVPILPDFLPKALQSIPAVPTHVVHIEGNR